MASAGLLTIKRRIKSITSTRKITKAMSLVATAKLRRSKENLNINKDFFSECTDVLREIFVNYSLKSIYTLENSSNNLYLIYTSKMGLCGGFNYNVINCAVDLIKSDSGNPLIMMIGQRGKFILNKLGYEITEEIWDLPDVPSYDYAEAISKVILSRFQSGIYGQINVIYTHFISGIKQVPRTYKLLPLSYEYNDFNKDIIAFEPSMESLAEESIKLYMNEQILYCLLNSSASEHAARMNAMNSATRNADELLNKLKQNYNRVRQSIITQEISEIVGGAEAMK